MTHTSIVGTWRLDSFDVRDEVGRITYPFGPDAVGFIIYTSDGHMAVQFGRANRPSVPDADWLAASDEQIAAASRDFIAYSGTYELRDNEVVHHVDMSLVPNWIGTELVRATAFDADRITLSTPPTPVGGRQQLATLVWRRV